MISAKMNKTNHPESNKISRGVSVMLNGIKIPINPAVISDSFLSIWCSSEPVGVEFKPILDFIMVKKH